MRFDDFDHEKAFENFWNERKDMLTEAGYDKKDLILLKTLTREAWNMALVGIVTDVVGELRAEYEKLLKP